MTYNAVNRGSSVGVVTRTGDVRPKAFVSTPGKEKGFLCSLFRGPLTSSSKGAGPSFLEDREAEEQS
jgi:hypothetical protein